MSQPPSDLTDDLQFDVAELPVATGAVAVAPQRACIGCRRPIVGTYFAIGDRLVCPSCRAQVDVALPGSGFARLIRATVFGLGAGLLGAAIWFAIRKVAGLQIGLVAVLVGYLVGKAVKNGSGNRGGRGYQVLAVALTYACIAANYMPDVYQGLMEARDQAVATDTRNGTPPPRSTMPLPVKVVIRLAITFVLALALPFLMATKNPIGLLIIGFALWEAWKFTARRRLAITGPYQVSPGPGGPGLPTAGVAR